MLRSKKIDLQRRMAQGKKTQIKKRDCNAEMKALGSEQKIIEEGYVACKHVWSSCRARCKEKHLEEETKAKT